MSIVHYFNPLYEDACAEVIPHGKLKETMTNHGLGSGYYGFIDISDKNTRVGLYRDDIYDKKTFEIKNPLILQKNDIFDEEGEIISDNIRFSRLSHALNYICYYVVSHDIKSIDLTIDIIKNILKSYPIYFLNKVTETFSPKLSDILSVTKSFTSDYYNLMKTNPNDECYVYMPINYLLYLYGYDGIYNLGGDVASKGSVKYIFNNSCLCRGYPVNFKTRHPMLGKLIFKY